VLTPSSDRPSAIDDMANILIAASPKPREVLQRILVGHELTCATTMSQAERLLDTQSFDLIICTVVFDDSRMLDFLRSVKAKDGVKHIPFVCARLRPSLIISRISLEAVAFTCRALGAVGFLDMADYKHAPDRQFRSAIERFLKRKIRKKPKSDS
jgi:CheY-like chemotaxis protein